MIYTESDLTMPVLIYISSKKEGITTSELIKYLSETLKPAGKDLKILKNRKDNHFSQKVRNIVSHKKTKKGIFFRKFAKYKKINGNGLFKITPCGLKYIEKNIDVFDFVESNGFSEKEREKIINNDFANLIIEEGYIKSNDIKARQRSRKLIEIAKDHFKIKDKIYCKACDFNFEDFYGESGKNFIEIHHLKPIFSYEEKFKQSLERALKNVVPICSNCHRIIHRKKANVLNVEKLKKIIAKQKYLLKK